MNISRRHLLGVFLAFACVAPLGAAERAPSPTPAASEISAHPGAGVPGERFEGYLWLDADGQPLPFQSDAAIEEFLREAEVESMKKIGTGITVPQKAVLARNGVRAHAAFKHVEESKKNVTDTTAGKTHLYREWRDSHVYDVAAYRLDRLLGLDRVPPVVIRKIRQTEGVLVMWLEGTVTQTKLRDEGWKPKHPARWGQQMQLIYIFDNLVANRDRNLGNTLFDGNWRAWSIDCSRCFGTSKQLLYPQALNHCERGLWEALKNLDEKELKEQLGDYLTTFEIKALLSRRDQIIERLQEQIDELGEIHVLYDLEPASERAPWAND